METLDKCEEKMVEEKDTLCFRSPAEVVLTYDSEVKVLQNSLEVNGKNENGTEIGDMTTEKSEEDEERAENEVGKLLPIELEREETVSVSEDMTISEIQSPPVGSKTELAEKCEREVVDSKCSKVVSVDAPGREMKVQGGEILESANAQIGNLHHQVASGEEVEEKEEEEGQLDGDVAEPSVLTTAANGFVVTDVGRVDSGNHSGVSEPSGGESVSGGKAMEGEGPTSPAAADAENVSDATEPVKGSASAGEEAVPAEDADEKKLVEEKGEKAAEEDAAGEKLTDEKVREMDAVVTEMIPVASSSPSLEKWDSFDIIGDLVDQVELLCKCCANVLFGRILLLSENLEIVASEKSSSICQKENLWCLQENREIAKRQAELYTQAPVAQVCNRDDDEIGDDDEVVDDDDGDEVEVDDDDGDEAEVR